MPNAMRSVADKRNEMHKKIMINHKSSTCHLKAHKMLYCSSVCSLASPLTRIHDSHRSYTRSMMPMWWLTPLSPPLRPTHSTSFSYQKRFQRNPLSSQASQLLCCDRLIRQSHHWLLLCRMNEYESNAFNRTITFHSKLAQTNFMYRKLFEWQSKCATLLLLLFDIVAHALERFAVERHDAINTN